MLPSCTKPYTVVVDQPSWSAASVTDTIALSVIR